MYKKSKVFLALTLVFALLVSVCSAATYTVKKGDNLTRIAKEYGVTVQEIADENSIKDPNLIYVGQEIVIPNQEEESEPAAPSAAPFDGVLLIYADGEVGIVDRNELFGGDAAQGIADLIVAGAVKVNGMVVGEHNFTLNGRRVFWKNEDGTWSWNAQKLFHGENLSYEQAVLDFVNGITCLRGTGYELTIEDGKVVALNATIYDAGMAETLTRNDTYTTFTGVGSVDEDAVDPSTVQFDNAKVEGNPKGQELVLYWEADDGWHLKRANSQQVYVDVVTTPGANGAKDNYTGTVNGKGITDSRLTLSYSESWNRPTQPIRAIGWMGDTGANMYQWTAAPGITIGFSRVDPKGDLEAGIAKAENALAIVEVSKTGDGSDIASASMWVTQEYYDIFTKAVNDAKAVLNKPAATGSDYEGALYRLAQAYGGQTGDRFSWLDNQYFGKAKDDSYDTGYNGTGFWTFAKKHFGTSSLLVSIQENGKTPITDASFDQYFKGTAAEGVEEILNAGKFVVNGFALPATESEFNINLGFITLVKKDTGWSSSVHKGNTSDPTFEAARTKLAEGLTKFAGLYVDLYDEDGDGFTDRIETTVKQSVRVDELIVDGGSVKIDRTNFKVAVKEGAQEINDVVFAAENVDSALQAGDIALYWETPEGFHIERCASKVGLLTEGTDHGYYVFDGVRYEDVGGVTKYHLAKANRPGQFLEAHRTLGLLGKVEIIAWTVGDYQIAAYSNVDSKAILTQGIAAAKAVQNAAAAADAVTALSTQIAAAEAILADTSATAADLDRMFYELALAVDAVVKA